MNQEIKKQERPSKQQKLPTIHEKAAFNQVYIKGGRPLAVYQKHGMKVLQKTNTIIIHGMTSTITKAVKLSIFLRKEFPYLKYQMKSDSVPTIVKNEDGSHQLKQRSCVHIVLTKNFSQKRDKD